MKSAVGANQMRLLVSRLSDGELRRSSSSAFMSLVLMLMMIRESDCILITQASRTASDSHISLQRLFTANDRQVLSMRDTTLYDVQDEEMRTAVISFHSYDDHL